MTKPVAALSIYEDRLLKRARRTGRGGALTVRLDLRLESSLAERADALAAAAGESIDAFFARLVRETAG